MNIQHCGSYKAMSQMAFDSIVRDLKISSNRLLCLATGNSPTGLYAKLSEVYSEHSEYFNTLKIIKLDEWGGLGNEHPDSCEAYLKTHVLKPLHIAEDRYISFKGNAVNPEKECERVQGQLDAIGPIDICVLGLGKNGHIGFNEPGEHLSLGCHLGQLSQVSMQHQMASNLSTKPTFGLTLGMGDILQSKKIMLLITGDGKKTIIEQFLTKKITTKLPASLLWLHANVECYIDSDSLSD